jgi:hypothetical protein
MGTGTRLLSRTQPSSRHEPHPAEIRRSSAVNIHLPEAGQYLPGRLVLMGSMQMSRESGPGLTLEKGTTWGGPRAPSGTSWRVLSAASLSCSAHEIGGYRRPPNLDCSARDPIARPARQEGLICFRRIERTLFLEVPLGSAQHI